MALTQSRVLNLCNLRNLRIESEVLKFEALRFPDTGPKVIDQLAQLTPGSIPLYPLQQCV